VRAISIGTVAAAQLLEGGARPRAMVWIAPVRPRTVVPRFASQFVGFWAWLAASLFYGPVAWVEPVEAIAGAGVPVHVVGSSGDKLLDAQERAQLEAAARASGGTWHDLGANHVFLALRARRLSLEELSVLRPLAPPRGDEAIAPLLGALPSDLAESLAADAAARERFAHLAATQPGATPLDLAAAALANDDWSASWRMLWLHRIRPFSGETIAERTAAFSLRGPQTPLAAEVVEYFSAPHDQAWRYDRRSASLAPRAVGALSARRDALYQVRYRLDCGLNYQVSFDLGTTWVALLMERRDLDAATIELARYLLKSLRIPDRLRELPDGSTALEAFWQGAWEPVPCAAERDL